VFWQNIEQQSNRKIDKTLSKTIFPVLAKNDKIWATKLKLLAKIHKIWARNNNI